MNHPPTNSALLRLQAQQLGISNEDANWMIEEILKTEITGRNMLASAMGMTSEALHGAVLEGTFSEYIMARLPKASQ